MISTGSATRFEGWTRAELDAAYDNWAACADADEYLHAWDEQSAAARQRIGRLRGHRVERDVRYAGGTRASIDLFCGPGTRPTLVFIHGGYWHLNSKERFSFVAEGPLALGINVAVLGYTLAPQARMDQIVAEVRLGVHWVVQNAAEFGGDCTRVAVAGWSAGAHLAALSMLNPDVCYGLTISGIFDLEPIRLGSLNEHLRMSEFEAKRNSPIANLPRTAGALTVCAGAEELPELRRQSAAYHEAWVGAGLEGKQFLVPGRHHFAVLDELARPDGALIAALAEWEW